MKTFQSYHFFSIKIINRCSIFILIQIYLNSSSKIVPEILKPSQISLQFCKDYLAIELHHNHSICLKVLKNLRLKICSCYNIAIRKNR
ncbi:unnamed protein product [Paramecium octaurelia]|uniref:Uncharacterized protein n=1 Tax=Paramecium octaurelia TaxID=43137 RepID=A0A8S1UYY5_PAROT|nr:unnamed protein product [Paramecium octaurelia]